MNNADTQTTMSITIPAYNDLIEAVAARHPPVARGGHPELSRSSVIRRDLLRFYDALKDARGEIRETITADELARLFAVLTAEGIDGKTAASGSVYRAARYHGIDFPNDLKTGTMAFLRKCSTIVAIALLDAFERAALTGADGSNWLDD